MHQKCMQGEGDHSPINDSCSGSQPLQQLLFAMTYRVETKRASRQNNILTLTEDGFLHLHPLCMRQQTLLVPGQLHCPTSQTKLDEEPSPGAVPFMGNPTFSSSESVSSSNRSLNSFLSSSFLSSGFLRLISGKFKSSSWKKQRNQQ